MPSSAHTLQLGPTEMYAGVVLGKNGERDYHLILLPDESEKVGWKASCEWAEKCGGSLPTRRELSILFGNLKEQFKKDWYSSGEQHESESGWAWCQGFNDGYQLISRQSYELRARAVRRLAI
ncbi:hypothetical protein WI76_17540 [Burkholderia ubonensis]|nr:hypothetical protein WI76_17540 [Burkholderia ubonensis]